jgi:hypothetical protein
MNATTVVNRQTSDSHTTIQKELRKAYRYKIMKSPAVLRAAATTNQVGCLLKCLLPMTPRAAITSVGPRTKPNPAPPPTMGSFRKVPTKNASPRHPYGRSRAESVIMNLSFSGFTGTPEETDCCASSPKNEKVRNVSSIASATKQRNTAPTSITFVRNKLK